MIWASSSRVVASTAAVVAIRPTVVALRPQFAVSLAGGAAEDALAESARGRGVTIAVRRGAFQYAAEPGFSPSWAVHTSPGVSVGGAAESAGFAQSLEATQKPWLGVGRCLPEARGLHEIVTTALPCLGSFREWARRIGRALKRQFAWSQRVALLDGS